MNTLASSTGKQNITCPLCNFSKMTLFFKLENVPISSNHLWDNRKDALNCPKGDIKLAFCHNCGFIINSAFKGDIVYDSMYENSLFHSSNFKEFAESLTKKIITKYSLIEKNIIEISYGKSNFLELFCKLGKNKGISFDPTYNSKKEMIKSDIKIIPEFYSEKYRHIHANLIFSWHVLEHTGKPKELLSQVRQAIGEKNDIHLYFGVPNGMDNFNKLFIWDIIYEHYSYFTPASLRYIFETNGYKVTELSEEHQGQSICIDVTPTELRSITNVNKNEIENIWEDLVSFSDNYFKKVIECRNKIKPLIDSGQKAVIWGAGSRGVTFLNTLKTLQIECAIDINPRKQGMYIPGTGHKIVRPEYLKHIKPGLVIIMNPIYEDEIKSNLDSLNLNPHIIIV